MKFLDETTVEKANKFMAKEAVFCTMKGILKKPTKDVNGDGEPFYKFNLRTTNKDGYSQSFACIIPAVKVREFKEKDFMELKDKEILIIPSLANQLSDWESKETGKSGTNNRLTFYVSRMAVIGEGESNKTFDDELTVNW